MLREVTKQLGIHLAQTLSTQGQSRNVSLQIKGSDWFPIERILVVNLGFRLLHRIGGGRHHLYGGKEKVVTQESRLLVLLVVGLGTARFEFGKELWALTA